MLDFRSGVEELLRSHGIRLKDTAPGRYYTQCPRCSARRTKAHQRLKVLGVTIDDEGGVRWGCNHCNWTGPTKGTGANGRGRGRADENIRTTYDYNDEHGQLLYQKVRGTNPKFRFWQRRPDGAGGWIDDLHGIRKVIYRLPEVSEAIAAGHPVMCVEGEKDADSLWALGVPATCSPDGAAKPGQKPKWRIEYSEMLRDADLIVMGDNDPAGYAHVDATASMSVGIAKRVRVLDLAKHWPDAPKGGDVSDWLKAGHTREELDALVETATEPGCSPEARLLPSPAAPMQVARQFVEQHCLHNGSPSAVTLRAWHGGWWAWLKTHWVEMEEHTVRPLLYAFTEDAFYLDDKGEPKPWLPNRRRIGDLLEALSAITILSDDIEQPCWIYGRARGPIVAVANGLLDLTSRELYEHTPAYFNQTAVPFDYDAAAPAPEKWFAFLAELWPQELAAIDLLAEWFGYVISGRLDLHKILLTVGPTRGGKGVIGRVLTALVGQRNVCGPTLNSLGGDFGLAPLIGKPLAIISDARFAGKNGGVVVERLLSISGEDTITVNRKYRDQWTGKLPSRLHVISNELPKLGDASTAVVGRFVLLLLTRSWLGKEDHNLEPALLAELPGILNWALGGLERLTLRNGFTRLASAEDAIIAMRDLASPVVAFVREECVFGAYETGADALYAAYREWCEANEHAKASKHVFGRDLAAAVSTVKKERRGRGKNRHHVYCGIALRSALAADETEEDTSAFR